MDSATCALQGHVFIDRGVVNFRSIVGADTFRHVVLPCVMNLRSHVDDVPDVLGTCPAGAEPRVETCPGYADTVAKSTCRARSSARVTPCSESRSLVPMAASVCTRNQASLAARSVVTGRLRKQSSRAGRTARRRLRVQPEVSPPRLAQLLRLPRQLDRVGLGHWSALLGRRTTGPSRGLPPRRLSARPLNTGIVRVRTTSAWTTMWWNVLPGDPFRTAATSGFSVEVVVSPVRGRRRGAGEVQFCTRVPTRSTLR